MSKKHIQPAVRRNANTQVSRRAERTASALGDLEHRNVVASMRDMKGAQHLVRSQAIGHGLTVDMYKQSRDFVNQLDRMADTQEEQELAAKYANRVDQIDAQAHAKFIVNMYERALDQ
ncbi:hypothetical protein [Tsukamurella spumae]|uniref:Uncharacterized protein n=1 Tax=Tsukamurella spumae TaxID=44753 RepID=A0A846X045_9ACTN|nr:hypothetical protein [Tsukamurella spumae]NKY18897.1 hypothetical protein [Tsukamurella spumae]